jgi:two-component system NtrC family response regulator
MAPGKILIVDDDQSLARVLKMQLESAGYGVMTAASVQEALELLNRSEVDLIVTDLNLPGESGMDLLKKVRVDYPETALIMITAFATVETAVEAMKAGAYDYLIKPVHPYDLKAVVGRAMERNRLLDEVRSLRTSIDQKFGFENIIGYSSGLMRVLENAARVAQSDATVLIQGETGTGKELLARAIHFNSSRSKRPFAVINCGAIPHDLFESELFGHVKGSFTGAVAHKRGKIEVADGGTVFLDEIGEMPLDLQVRLLRLLQEGEIEKVGSSAAIKVDVRIISATHRDLEALVPTGAFREDLYYRLAVVPIMVPPLRNRTEDIPELVIEFFRRSLQRHKKPSLRLPQDILPLFTCYDWPGNIRQLQNVIERVVVLCPGDEVTIADLPDFLKPFASGVPPADSIRVAEGMTLDAVERQLIVQALGKFGWNQSQTARYLGITRKILMGRIAKHHIERDEAATTVSRAHVA